MNLNAKGILGIPRYSSIGPLSQPVDDQIPFKALRVAKQTRDELVQAADVSTVDVWKVYLSEMREDEMFAAVYNTIPGEVPERMITMMSELIIGAYLRDEEDIINHALLHEFGHHITSEVMYFNAGKEPLENLVNQGYLKLEDINHPDELRVDSINDLYYDIMQQNVPDIFNEDAQSMSGTQNGDVLGHEIGEAIANEYVGRTREDFDINASIDRGIKYEENR